MSGLRLRVAAPAKINLHLEVLRLRDDGYHEVRTILQSVALADTLTVTVRPGPFTVRSRTASMPRDGDNLVWRAAARFWRALGRDGDPSGVAVAVRKVVPAGAGLGGASSDAASALRVLREIWAPGEAGCVAARRGGGYRIRCAVLSGGGDGGGDRAGGADGAGEAGGALCGGDWVAGVWGCDGGGVRVVG